MTTAARPTFDPARGKDNKAPSFQYSSRDLASHTKLKFRQPGQGTTDEIGDRERLKQELLLAEQEYFAKKGKDGLPSTSQLMIGEDSSKETEEKRKQLLEEADRLANEDRDEEKSDDEDESEESSSDEDDDDEDDEDELLQMLEKIKQERAAEAEKAERERAEEDAEKQQKEALTGNPLLELVEEKRDFTIKRRWNDDTIFKNQARGVDENPKKRFVNDMIRSDFHRKFLYKYIH